MLSTLLVKTIVRGYHVYNISCEPWVGETFIVVYKTGNEHDRYVMAVYRDEELGGSHHWTSTTGDCGRAVRRSRSGGCKRLRKPGNSCDWELDGNFQRYQLLSDAYILVHCFLQQLRLHPLPMYVPRAECWSVFLIKLSVPDYEGCTIDVAF